MDLVSGAVVAGLVTAVGSAIKIIEYLIRKKKMADQEEDSGKTERIRTPRRTGIYGKAAVAYIDELGKQTEKIELLTQLLKERGHQEELHRVKVDGWRKDVDRELLSIKTKVETYANVLQTQDRLLARISDIVERNRNST